MTKADSLEATLGVHDFPRRHGTHAPGDLVTAPRVPPADARNLDPADAGPAKNPRPDAPPTPLSRRPAYL